MIILYRWQRVHRDWECMFERAMKIISRIPKKGITEVWNDERHASDATPRLLFALWLKSARRKLCSGIIGEMVDGEMVDPAVVYFVRGDNSAGWLTWEFFAGNKRRVISIRHESCLKFGAFLEGLFGDFKTHKTYGIRYRNCIAKLNRFASHGIESTGRNRDQQHSQLQQRCVQTD